MARAESGNSTSLAQELQTMATREKQRHDARAITYAMSHQERKGLSSIEVLIGNDSVELTEQQDMEGRFSKNSKLGSIRHILLPLQLNHCYRK
jgi:hypothetical protein